MEDDMQWRCIELGKQDTTLHSTRYYYNDKVLAVAIYYEQVPGKMKEMGRQYFLNDTLIDLESSLALPEAKTTLKVADSIRRECSKMLEL